MKKKNKDVNVVRDISESKNLETNVIGVVENNASKSPIPLIILFVALIGFAFGLPYVTDYIDAKKKDAPVVIPPQAKPKEPEEEKPVEKEETSYDMKETTTFTKNNLRFDTFQMKEENATHYFTFQITNMGANEVLLTNNNYYFELYSKERTLLARVKMVSNEVLKQSSSVTLSYEVNESTFQNTAKILLTEKQEMDYPQVTLNKNEAGEPVLLCTKGNRSISYVFDTNDKLQKVNDSYIVEKSIANYEEELNTYRLQTTTYNNLEGVSSSIAETSNGFTATTSIELAKANLKEMNSIYYFKKDTLARTVNFQMESMNYSCN